MSDFSRDEMMTVAASRLLWDGCVCFVGIGLPGTACNLARLTHAPGLVLIYESGTIGARPEVLPLSIGDGELATTATCVIPLPEVFGHYLQAGRVDLGFLGAAQIDRYGNLNSTVIGSYESPSTRLPGAGGAPEIVSHARQTFVVMKATPRAFVKKLDFCTSAGPRDGAGGLRPTTASGKGPRMIVTDLGLLQPHAESGELELTALYPGATVADMQAAVGWPLLVADSVEELVAPTPTELDTLRSLLTRTAAAHQRPVELPA